MMELVNETERAIARLAALGLAERCEGPPLHHHLARGRRVQPAKQMQQRALAGPRRAHHRYALAGRDGEIDAEQHRYVEGSAAVCLVQAATLEHRRRPGPTHSAAPPQD